MIHKLPYNGKWLVISDEQLGKFDPDVREAVLREEFKAVMNPLAHFLPHGVSWSSKVRPVNNGQMFYYPSEYPEKYKNDGAALLNDWTSDIILLMGPNQMGKTYIGTAWSGLRIVPMDKDEPIFTETPVEWHEWTGPKTWVVASYSWDNVGTVWKRYQELLPRKELGPYAPNWGKYPNEKGRARELSFRDYTTKSVSLDCGSVLKFLSYTQQQLHWEGFDADGAHLDEQCPVEKLTGLQRGFTTRGDYTPICMTLTGHVMEDRPDTGASGWIKPTLWQPTQDLAQSRLTISA